MKKVFFILTLSIIAFNLPAQNDSLDLSNNDWYDYEFDSIITVSFIGEDIFEFDSIIDNKHMHTLCSYGEFSTAMAIKARYSSKTKGFPTDTVSLNEFYIDVLEGYSNSSPFLLGKNEFIKKDGYSGLSVILEDDNNEQVGVAEFFLLNKSLYTFMVLYEDGNFDSIECELFLKNVEIGSDNSISQYGGTSSSYELGLFLGENFFFFLLIAPIIFFILKSRKKKNSPSSTFEN